MPTILNAKFTKTPSACWLLVSAVDFKKYVANTHETEPPAFNNVLHASAVELFYIIPPQSIERKYKGTRSKIVDECTE